MLESHSCFGYMFLLPSVLYPFAYLLGSYVCEFVCYKVTVALVVCSFFPLFCIRLQADFDVQLPSITVCHRSYEVLSLVGDPYEVPDGIGFSFLNMDCIILKQRNISCRIITGICVTLPGAACCHTDYVA